MRYIDEFRDRKLVDKLVTVIRQKSLKKVRFMEVCGGHTLAIRKFGIQHLLPGNIELLSGPGCPVCVTDRAAIDRAIAIARIPGTIVTTYGDLIRVPGSSSSLDQEKAVGADIRIVYSTIDALDIARKNPGRPVVFLGIGFETTTPASAVVLLEAERQQVNNFYLLSMHKVMPPAMAGLIEQGVRIDGYIGPGHVTAVAGADMYAPLLEKYPIAIVIAGFEPVDLLQSILMLVVMAEEERSGVEIQYKRAVTRAGNTKATEMVRRIFESADDTWRGLGIIPGSGLRIREAYSRFDAARHFNLPLVPVAEPIGCLCGEILRGMKRPDQCTLFSRTCTPANPVGACMVSSEGACQAYYHYR
jgi:hydrogenase expression/formation protein HypD